jgi:hypothetical protein
VAYSTTYPADYQKLYESALGTVKDSYQTQRDSLTQQQQALPYTYQAQKNQVSSQANQTARALDETNAQRGLYNSGTARTDLARNQATRDSGINDINNTQTQASTALQNQLNQLNSQESTAIAGIQGQEAAAQRSQDLSLANLMGTYNNEQTLAGQAQAADTANTKYTNQLALLNALQNYNVNAGYVSDQFTDISGYNYGDTLKQLLASLSVN